MAIISASYSVVVLLEDSLGKLYPTIDSTVAYGSGFYLIAGTGKNRSFLVIFALLLSFWMEQVLQVNRVLRML